MSFKNTIVVEVLGKVEPKGRGRVGAKVTSKKTGKAFTPVFTPQHTRKYEAQVKYAAGKAMGDQEPFSTPVEVKIYIGIGIPMGVSKRKRKAMIEGWIRPDKKPDIDNLVKAALDAINTVVMTDDKLVWNLQATKVYSSRPGLRIEVKRSPTMADLGDLD